MSEINYLAPFWTADLCDATAPLLKASPHGRAAIRKAMAAMPDVAKASLTKTVAAGRLPMLAANAHALPVLSAEGCAAIVERSYGYRHTPNEAEAVEHRIAEAVLAEVDPEYDAFLTSVLMTGLAPWFLMLWGRLPTRLTSLQIADYNPAQHSETAMHIDRDSAYTAVISLNPGDFEGGGTAIADGLVGDFVVPPLPAGYALIMDGQRTFHRGLPTVGNRKLLVVWADHRDDVW